jgi:hypothetical protein
MLPGGAVAMEQICGPADGGNEGYGVAVRIGMMLPMSLSDGAGRMPAWTQVLAVAQHAEAAGLDSAWVLLAMILLSVTCSRHGDTGHESNVTPEPDLLASRG